MHKRYIDIKNPQNRGYEFEQKIFKSFTNLGYKLLYEDELRKKYGWIASSIDFILELEAGIIIIQTKWSNTQRRSTKDVDNFINSIKYINKLYEKPYLYGLWISRIKPFDDNITKMKEVKIDCICCYDSMDELIEKSCNWITKTI
jgi:hypothetical protein